MTYETTYQTIYKSMIKILILIISLPTAMILHELVHVVQYILIYGDNLTYLTIDMSMGFDSFGKTSVRHIPGEYFTDWMSPGIEWLFYEIPAYFVTALVFWYGIGVYYWYVYDRHVGV